MTIALSDLWAEKQIEDYQENHSNTQGTLTEAYLCDWADRFTAKDLLLGASPSDATNLPWSCTSVAVRARGWEDGSAAPTKAVLVATYQDQASASSGGAVSNNWSDWTEHWEGGGEAITIGKNFKWVTDSKSVGNDQSGVKMFPMGTITLTGFCSDAQDGKPYILSTIGKTNVAEITIKGHAYPAESLLFLGADMNETLSNSDASVYQVTLKFAARVGITWNEFWRNDTDPPKWDTMVDTDGNHPYTTAAFSDINPINW